MGDKEKNTAKETNKQESSDVPLSLINSECLEKIHSQTAASTIFKKTLENTSSTIVSAKCTVSDNKIDKKVEKPSKESLKTNRKDLKEQKISVISNDSPIPKPRPSRIVTAASDTLRKEKIFRNQSDIFSLIEQPNAVTSIFSVNGAPSRRVYRQKDHSPTTHRNSTTNSLGNTEKPPSDTASIILPKSKITRENYNDEKRPSSSYRNPLTGTGLSSNDEYTKKDNKKRADGNPLLGLGYGSEAANSHSSHRIPPGGYAHKLW